MHTDNKTMHKPTANTNKLFIMTSLSSTRASLRNHQQDEPHDQNVSYKKRIKPRMNLNCMPLMIDGMVAAISSIFRGDLSIPLLSAISLGKNKIPRVSLQLLEFFNVY